MGEGGGSCISSDSEEQWGDVVAVLSRLVGHSREVELGSAGYVEKGHGCEQCWEIWLDSAVIKRPSRVGGQTREEPKRL